MSQALIRGFLRNYGGLRHNDIKQHLMPVLEHSVLSLFMDEEKRSRIVAAFSSLAIIRDLARAVDGSP